jgi:Uri superfamily endonuclease
LKGVYVLVIQVNKPVCVGVGALGKLSFKRGLYAYVGSAQNNLELRVARHKKRDKPLHWHIDYLLQNPHGKVIKVFYRLDGKAEECRIADLLSRSGAEPKDGFGCSDCHCLSHLFHAESFDFLSENMQQLK